MLKKLFFLPKAFKSNFRIPEQTRTITSFDELELPAVVSRFLSEFSTPTEIQAKSMKILLEGNDLIGIAPTGSGKTIAFALPALMKSAKLRKENSRPFISTVIVCPTRELSHQIFDTINPLARSLHLRVANLFGGASKYEQFDEAKLANVIVATPGRLADYSQSGAHNKLGKVEYLVLDEADQMLEMNFEDSLTTIVEQTPKERQTVLFSATWDHDIQLLAQNYLKESAYYLQIGNNATTINPNIEQHFRLSSPENIKSTIAQLLNNHSESKVLIFCNSKVETRDLAFELNDMTERPITFLTSDLTQEERTATMAKFRESVGGVMVATDVVSRGIDVKDIELVINYGFPHESSDFIHRIGRTGRGGKTGKSLTFIFRGNSRIEKSLRYISDLFVNENLPIPASLAEIIEQIGIKIYNNENKQPRIKEQGEREEKRMIGQKKRSNEDEEEEDGDRRKRGVGRNQPREDRQTKKQPAATPSKPTLKKIVKKKKADSDED